MICNSYRASTSTATIALAACGYFAMSGPTAVPAAAEEEATQNGWLAQVSTSASQVAEAEQNAKSEKHANLQPVEADSAKEPEPKVETKSEEKPEKKSAKKVAAKTDKARVSDAGDLFGSDPLYGEDYNAEGQVDIYGAKTAVDPPRPPLEIGRQQYTSGAYDESSTFLGEKNPLLPGLAVYGDWRTAVAYNNNGGKDIAQIATRLNLDVDLKITGTERIRSVGGLWIVAEGQGEMPGGGVARTCLTLGYDPQKQRFVGTWYGSMMYNLWVYEGSLDETGKRLVLETEGPDFAADGKTASYRETIELLTPDHRIFSSSMRGKDGTWTTFMTAHYRRSG